ncbi:MAG: SGNH/GDSL hydrolase family protein [Acidobacteriota bacterium]|nr:SGNH/GDSL hydrolase family protein [Acidobacteriota bacterium]
MGLGLCCFSAGAAPLELRQGDRIAIVGNTFAERLQLFGHLETRMRAAYPELRLSFRNLAWSADEVTLQPRPLNFGPLEEHLAFQRVDVALLFFGANEARAGAAGVESFERELRRLLARVGQRSFSGSDGPIRLALVSPIPQEQTELGPDVVAHNRDLALYRDAVSRVAGELGVSFFDIFDSVADAMRDGAEPLTINGLHLSESGDRRVTDMLVGALAGPAATAPRAAIAATFPEGGACRWNRLPIVSPGGSIAVTVDSLVPGTWKLVAGGEVLAEAPAGAWLVGVEVTAQALTSVAATAEDLRRTVVAKDRLFFDRWRAVNGYYIYGDRREPFGVHSFPPEMTRFDERVAEHDRRLAELAEPASIDCQLVRAR